MAPPPPQRAQPTARQGNLFTPGAIAGQQLEAVLALDAPVLRQWQERLSQFQQPLFEASSPPAQGESRPDWVGTANTGESDPETNAAPQQSSGQATVLEPIERDWAQGEAATTPAMDGGLITDQGNLFSAAGLVSPGEAAADPCVRAANLDPLALVAQPLQFWRWPEAPQRGAALYFVIDRPSHLATPLLLYVGETGQADRRWKGEHDCKDYLAAYGEALQQVGLECQLSIRFWSDAPAQVRERRALEQALIRLWQPPFNKETRGRWATPFTT